MSEERTTKALRKCLAVLEDVMQEVRHWDDVATSGGFVCDEFYVGVASKIRERAPAAIAEATEALEGDPNA